jgi:hypothetical protein
VSTAGNFTETDKQKIKSIGIRCLSANVSQKPYGRTVKKKAGFLNSIKKEKNYYYEELTSMVDV